jgi:hypothetical protein
MAEVYGNRSELITHALEELKVVAFGQPPSASEYEAADRYIDMVLAELAARNIATVYVPSDPNEATIPIEVMRPLSQVLARHVASLYSIGVEEVSQLFPAEGDPLSPENRLRAVIRSRPTYANATPDYF